MELDPLVVENFSLNSRFFLQTKEERKKILYEKLLDHRYGWMLKVFFLGKEQHPAT